MAAADASKVATVDIPSETGADTSELVDATGEATDNDTTTSIPAALNWKIGKSPDDAMRIEYAEDKADIASGDTITVFHGMLHNWGDSQLLAYTSATAVTKTDQLNATPSGGTSVFTLTTAFIGQLFDQGSGKWAVRFSEKDSYLAGDTNIQEVDADLTVSGATTLDGVLFARAPTFPLGQVNLGLAGVVFTRAPTFPSGQVALQLNGVTFAKAPTFPLGAVQAGAVTITGALFTRAPTFPLGRVDLRINGVTFTRVPTFAAGQVNLRIVGATFTRVPTFPVGQVNLRINGTLFIRVPTFPKGQVQVDTLLPFFASMIGA